MDRNNGSEHNQQENRRLLRSLILKPKSLWLLILTLFLSTTRDTSLSLILLFSGQLLDTLSTSGDLIFLNFALVWVFLISYIVFSLITTSAKVVFRRDLKINLRDSIFNFVIDSPSPLEISAQKSLGYLKSVEEKIFNGIDSLLNFLTNFVGLFVQIIIFNVYNYKLALISIPIIIFFTLIPMFAKNYHAKLGKKYAEIERDKTSRLLNLINGFSIFAMFQRKNVMPKVFSDTRSPLNKHLLGIIARFNAMVHFVPLIYFIFVAIINIVVGYFVTTKLINFGAFLVANSLAKNLFQDGSTTINHLQNFLQIRGVAKEITPKKREIKNIGAFKNITIKNLVFNHQNNAQPLFNHLNLKFEEGKKYALIGPSGCGKSTLALILLKLLDPPSQSIFWSNIDYENLNFEDISKETNFVNGNFTIFQGSLRENLTLEKNIEDSKILEVVNLLGLNDIPLDRQINKDSISTGQRQRVLVGRALLRNCKLLILDEALANVDRQNAKRILKKLLSDKELTLIHITHHLKSEENYDHVINLGGQNG